MKRPDECESMVEICAEIDHIDKQVVNLIGQRFKYVKAAAKFKSSDKDVKAPERFKAMLLRRRVWAQDEGLNPDVIEKMYADLVNHFIEEELNFWKNQPQ